MAPHLAHARGTKAQPGLTRASCQFRVTRSPCVLARPGEKREFAKKAPVPCARPALGTAKSEKPQTEAWARSESEEPPSSKAKDAVRGSASARLARLCDYSPGFTPRERRRDQPGHSAKPCCRVPLGVLAGFGVSLLSSTGTATAPSGGNGAGGDRGLTAAASGARSDAPGQHHGLRPPRRHRLLQEPGPLT